MAKAHPQKIKFRGADYVLETPKEIMYKGAKYVLAKEYTPLDQSEVAKFTLDVFEVVSSELIQSGLLPESVVHSEPFQDRLADFFFTQLKDMKLSREAAPPLPDELQKKVRDLAFNTWRSVLDTLVRANVFSDLSAASAGETKFREFLEKEIAAAQAWAPAQRV